MAYNLVFQKLPEVDEFPRAKTEKNVYSTCFLSINFACILIIQSPYLEIYIIIHLK